MNPPDFTVLIPVYNEEECLIPNVGRLLRFFRERGLNGEIMLGSNGSTDATLTIGGLFNASPLPVRFFHLERRRAVGEVFRTALHAAASPLLISMDMDLPVDLEFITEALHLLQRHDLIVGSKQSGLQQRSAWRRLGSGLFILFAQTALSLPYDDYSLGAKAYRISSVKPLSEGLSFDTNYVLEIIHASRRAGLSIAVLPVACWDYRKSRFNLVQEALTRFSHLFRTWIRNR
ncbi:MAG: glycosyltransferase family 2 protein [Syntrophobacter sp.]